jgi:glycerophosphoryl diester phosphodiesterase
MRAIKTFLFLLLIFLFSCKKNILQSNPNTKAIGHGGMGISNTIPINTFESINQCLFSGADGVEFDIQLTKDSVWVVYHDSELNSGTNLGGSIFDKPWDYMKDAYYMNPIYANYGLINADELLGNIENKEQFVFSLDLKNYNQNTNLAYVRTLAENYVELVRRHNISSNSYLSTSRISLSWIRLIR